MKEEKQNEIETKEEVENTELVEVEKETWVQKGAKFVKKVGKKVAITCLFLGGCLVAESYCVKRGYKKGYDEGYNVGKEMYEKYNNNNTLENVEYEVVNDDNNE
jgi:hypothetical protein